MTQSLGANPWGNGPMYHSCSIGSSDKTNTVNCCWCGSLIHDLNIDAQADKPVRRYCQKCGKPNDIHFRWSLDITSYPSKIDSK